MRRRRTGDDPLEREAALRVGVGIIAKVNNLSAFEVLRLGEG